MSENTTSKASSKPIVKKRTIYNPKGMLSLPEWAEKDTLNKYRWVSKRKTSRSDGFDPRGWSIAKDPVTNASLEAHDTVLYKMPLEEWEAMKEFKLNKAQQSTASLLEAIEGQNDRLRYEVEKLGGKYQNDFSIERKN